MLKIIHRYGFIIYVAYLIVFFQAARQNSRSKAEVLGEKLRMTLLENLAKQEALGKALGESFVLPKMFHPKEDSLFNLPPLPTAKE